MKSKKLKIYENRLLVAELIEQVILGKIKTSIALSKFPKDKSDINIKCAFDALVHREADEDLRKKIPDYATVQDDYLIDICKFLKENEDLPQNIILEYLKYHSDNLIYEEDKGIKNIFKKLKRMINF